MATATPYYGPNESADEIFLERTFVAGDFICGLGYGAQLVLYTMCALYLWSQRKQRSSSMYLLAYITILLIVETIFAGVQARTVQVIYIDNRNYPGGPWAYFLATQYLAINVMFYATLFMLTFLSDILVLWRCWVIWSAFGRRQAILTIFFPALMLLASFVMGTLWTLQSSKPGLSLYSHLPIAFGTSYYAISLGVNIVLTVLITVRLLIYRRTISASMGAEHAKHYVSLATIMVESAALYSVFSVLFLITYAINNPINQIFLALTSNAQQIASYLIIYRLAEGRGWSKDTVAQQTLTAMNFESPAPRRQAGTMIQIETFQSGVSDTPAASTLAYAENKSVFEGSGYGRALTPEARSYKDWQSGAHMSPDAAMATAV